ncbi:dihydropteroate synthase [Streptococcus moroccensis]|uniref:Dihydropteroate synthase n=1 Tax=Streptococcus moroccensis TaxID=1451356 RepID=A0ABT9YU71_9STRE|nr:dihydropteroate synthase [Streptococcus moroccensis]MDQ0223528.1 dihydropteroate synthase [Streptococcus moroccensis]
MITIDTLRQQPTIMGILNVTPDSFSDGGNYVATEQAMAQVGKMLAEGATVIDVGGESTRPGAAFVSADEEINRVVPIIKAIKDRYDCLISIDSYKTETVRAALDAGADIINDVWAGLHDGQMLSLAAERQVPIILMHNQEKESYTNITEEVCAFLSNRARAAKDAGLSVDKIWLDPGFGFAKNPQQNIDLLKGLDQVCQLGYPVLFGISRKRVVDYLLGGGTSPLERDQATAALSAYAIEKGCDMVRVHNVAANTDVLKAIAPLRK